MEIFMNILKKITLAMLITAGLSTGLKAGDPIVFKTVKLMVDQVERQVDDPEVGQAGKFTIAVTEMIRQTKALSDEVLEKIYNAYKLEFNQDAYKELITTYSQKEVYLFSECTDGKPDKNPLRNIHKAILMSILDYLSVALGSAAAKYENVRSYLLKDKQAYKVLFQKLIESTPDEFKSEQVLGDAEKTSKFWKSMEDKLYGNIKELVESKGPNNAPLKLDSSDEKDQLLNAIDERTAQQFAEDKKQRHTTTRRFIDIALLGISTLMLGVATQEDHPGLGPLVRSAAVVGLMVKSVDFTLKKTLLK
jgi:hypothetical protein